MEMAMYTRLHARENRDEMKVGPMDGGDDRWGMCMIGMNGIGGYEQDFSL